MAGMRAGIRKLCVAYDVERYSGRGTRREYATQQRLSDVLEFAFREAGVPLGSAEVQEQGDGGIALLPTGAGVDEPRLIVGLINALAQGLNELNEDLIEQARVRLRVGLHEGVIHHAAHGHAGPAVIEACRLRDAGEVRAALARSDAPMVVVVADGLYRDVLSHGYHGLPGTAFTPVDVEAKSYAGRAWVYLPASLAPGGARPAGAGESAAREAAVQPASPARLQDFLDASPEAW